MRAGAFVTPAPGAHLLFAARRADARSHVERNAARRTPSMNAVESTARQVRERREGGLDVHGSDWNLSLNLGCLTMV